MTKDKHAKALFEVISSTRAKHPESTCALPDWMRPGGTPLAEAPAEPAPQEPEPPAPTPVASVADRRLMISLNHVSAMVAAFGLVVLLAAAFLLGRISAEPAEPAELAVPAKPDSAAKKAGHKPAPRTKEGLDCPKLARGKKYLVIYAVVGSMPDHESLAVHVARHCCQNGVKAVKAAFGYPQGASGFVVVATDEFDPGASPNAPAVKRLAAKIEQAKASWDEAAPAERRVPTKDREWVSVGNRRILLLNGQSR